jgi:hypothetical protein
MKKWEKKEKKDGKDFGGKRQKGSGNYWASPGDVKTSDFLIDSKQTDKKSFSVSYNMWDKIYEEALLTYRIPLLSILLQDVELVVLSKEDFLKLTQAKD